MKTKFLKRYFYLFLTLFTVCVSVALTSCGDDDDNNGTPNNNGNNDTEVTGKGTAYTTVDGRTVKYKYLYVLPLEENGVITSYELWAYTVDPDYYIQHPDEIKDNMYTSMLFIALPVSAFNSGVITFDNVQDIEISYDDPLKGMLVDDNPELEKTLVYPSTHIWYCDDYTYKNKVNIAVSRTGNTFKATGIDVPMLASKMGVDEGIDDTSRKTTASFGFESDNLDTRKLSVENVNIVKDAKTINILRSIRKQQVVIN